MCKSPPHGAHATLALLSRCRQRATASLPLLGGQGGATTASPSTFPLASTQSSPCFPPRTEGSRAILGQTSTSPPHTVRDVS